MQNCNTGTAHYEKTVDPVRQSKCKKKEKKKKKQSWKKRKKKQQKLNQNLKSKPQPKIPQKSKRKIINQLILLNALSCHTNNYSNTLYLLQELLKITDDA